MIVAREARRQMICDVTFTLGAACLAPSTDLRPPVLSLIVSFLIRLALVGLFLPFSALDKVLNPDAAVKQAQDSVHSGALSKILIGAAFCVEVVMSLAILTGFFDRLAAVILAGYCGVTALLWKQFWNTEDFCLKGPSKGAMCSGISLKTLPRPAAS